MSPLSHFSDGQVVNQFLAGFTASAVAGDGRVYFTSERGEIYVVRAGPEFEVLATNKMDEVCMATPAISDGEIFLRTHENLYCVSEKR